MEEGGLTVPLTAAVVQQYSAVDLQDIDNLKGSSTQHTFNATAGDNLQLNRQLF
jgi:hypothetical protein